MFMHTDESVTLFLDGARHALTTSSRGRLTHSVACRAGDVSGYSERVMVELRRMVDGTPGPLQGLLNRIGLGSDVLDCGNDRYKLLDRLERALRIGDLVVIREYSPREIRVIEREEASLAIIRTVEEVTDTSFRHGGRPLRLVTVQGYHAQMQDWAPVERRIAQEYLRAESTKPGRSPKFQQAITTIVDGLARDPRDRSPGRILMVHYAPRIEISRPPEPSPTTPQRRPKPDPTWIELEVVTKDNEVPVEGVDCRFTLPSGGRSKSATESDGIVFISTISSPGMCEVELTNLAGWLESELM